MGKSSIYNQIVSAFKEHTQLPYIFQDIQIAGKTDVIYSILHDEIGHKEKKLYTLELMVRLEETMKKSYVDDELRDWLSDIPPIIYYSTINRRLRLLLSEGEMDGELLYPIGLQLATGGHTVGEVKLGILILGYFQNDLSRQIIRTLGLHSDFTIFAIAASDNFKDHNSFIFDLAKNTCGYGKLACLAFLEPITKEQKNWVFKEGGVNPVAKDLSAVICLGKEDMVAYYNDLSANSDNFSYISNLLAYGGLKGIIRNYPGSLSMTKEYIGIAADNINSFIDLAAITTIYIDLESSWGDFIEYEENADGWTYEENNALKDECRRILNGVKSEDLVFEELDDPMESTELILTVIDRLGYIPIFRDLVPLLERDLFDLDIMEFTLIDHPKDYVGVILEYLEMVLPDEIFTGPQNIEEDQITPEYKPDIWLVYLLKAMIKYGEYKEQFLDVEFIEKDFLQKCLKCRFPDVRIEAIKAFQLKRDLWGSEVDGILEEALKIEPMGKIKKRLYRFLGKSSEEEPKECRYVQIKDIEIKPSPRDIKIMDSEIAGSFYRDMNIVKGEVEKGDMLYLIREPDNKYDEKAILVTAEDGYVLGYIPKKDNPYLSPKLDSGEELYAILYDDIGRGRPSISIMLSRPGEKEGYIIPFPGIW